MRKLIPILMCMCLNGWNVYDPSYSVGSGDLLVYIHDTTPCQHDKLKAEDSKWAYAKDNDLCMRKYVCKKCGAEVRILAARQKAKDPETFILDDPNSYRGWTFVDDEAITTF